MPHRIEPFCLPELPKTKKPDAAEAEFLRELKSRISPVDPNALRGTADSEKGVPLDRARFYYGPDGHVEWVADLRRQLRTAPFNPTLDIFERCREDQRLRRELTTAMEHLQSNLLGKLKTGELVAFGFSSHA